MSTENKEMVQNVSVTLMGAEMNKMTGVDGAFGFADVPAGGQYTVMPEKNDDPLNGVSTLDLVFIQRHILNVQKLDSPYKLIAADANKDGKITASDLVELRKLILGTNTAFSNNKSWRFVDKSYTFKDPSFAQGEAFPEAYYIDNLDTDMVTDFIAVKTGDVNGSVKASNIAGETVFRNASTLHLITNEQKYKAGTEIKVPVRLAASETITGIQFTLDFDQNALQLMHIDPAMSGMSDQNFGFNQLGAGKVTFSWNADQPRSLSKDDVLFTLTFRTTDLGSLAESLALNSVATAAEAYTSDFAVIPVQMEVANRNNLVSQSQKTFVLHQNVPNPFKEVSNISFELPATMPVNISIYNLSGKMIKEYQVNGQQGVNTLEINRNDLTTGILYYTMKAGDFTTTKKMVVIE
jgi:hypothetical protein